MRLVSIALLIFGLNSISANGDSKNCNTKLAEVNFSVPNGRVLVNGISTFSYALKLVTQDLSLTESDLKKWRKKKLRVVSIGEGYGDLLPFLLSRGINAQAMDLWYNLKLSFLKTAQSY